VGTSELDKMLAMKEKSQTLGEFIHWLENEREPRVRLCQHRGQAGGLIDQWLPCLTSRDELMAEFFGIDLQKAEQEKKALLEQIRQGQPTGCCVVRTLADNEAGKP